jgi:hypothetical protein
VSKFFASLALAFCLTITSSAPVVWAQHDGAIQDEVCRQVQLRAQAAVEAGGPYKNKGAMQKVAAHVVDSAQRIGTIDAACASCIISQFARGISITEQEACGPDRPCQPGDCEHLSPCPNGGTCLEPVCVMTAEGDVICVEGFIPCEGSDAPLCNGTTDCPEGWVCVTTLCCDLQLCVPPEFLCDQD